MHAAGLGGHALCIETLLQNGADINARDNFGQTALIRATENLDAKDTIWLLLNKGADPNLKDNCGTTALHRCAEVENMEAVELLLQHHADVNSCNNAGDTPLNVSIVEGNKLIAKLLLERGADPTIANKENKSGADFIEERHRYSDIFPHIDLEIFYDDLKTKYTNPAYQHS